MKKQIKKIRFITSAIIMLLVTMLGALAQSPPSPAPIGIIVQINGIYINYDVKATNLATGDILTKTEVPSLELTNGIAMFDLSQFKEGYIIANPSRGIRGDIIEIVVCSVSPLCTKTFEITTLDPVKNEVNINIVDQTIVLPPEYIPPVPPPPEQIIIENPPVEIIKYFCADGTEVLDKSECPEENDSWIYWVIGVLCVLFGGVAGGWKIYNGKFKHFHRGQTTYHDPNTKHTNPKYRHRIWKESALGCISDVKKIQQGIDLSK